MNNRRAGGSVMRRPGSNRKPEQLRHGAATVELAIIMPVFLTMLLGLVELSSALNATQTLQGAIRDAGRLASMDYKIILGSSTNANTKIVQDIRNLLTASGIPGD